MSPIKQQLAYLKNARLAYLKNAKLAYLKNARLAYLKNARLASVEHFKKQKLEQSQSTNTEQLCIKDDQLCTSNISNTEDREGVWFWNKSANKTDSDLECSGKSDEEELDCEPEESRTEKEAVLETQLGEIQWNREGEKKLQRRYSKGS